MGWKRIVKFRKKDNLRYQRVSGELLLLFLNSDLVSELMD